MKYLSIFFFFSFFIFLTQAQNYDDYLGGGHDENISVTTSSDFQMEGWTQTASGDKTIAVSGLDGKLFDSTWKRNQPFEFVYGTEMQVVQGLEIALRTMKEKERALFVMPSEMAFGKKGSSTRIVPPFTPVVFEVEVEKIN